MLFLLDTWHHGCQTFRGSSTTPRSCRLSLFFSYYVQLRNAIYANNCIQLLTTSGVFSSITFGYVIQGYGVATHDYGCQYYVAISRDIDKQPQAPSTNALVDIYVIMFCILIFCCHVRTTKLFRPEGRTTKLFRPDGRHCC